MTTDQIVNQIVSAAEHKQWLLLFALTVIGLTSLVRWLGPKLHSKFGALVCSDRGGQLTALIIAEATALVAAASTGKPVTLPLAVGALVGGAGAGGIYNLVKNIFSPSDKKAVVQGATVTVAPAPKTGGFVSTRVLYAIAAAALVGMLASFAFAGCSSCQVPAPTTAQWKTAGIDAAKCIAPGVINAAGDAIIAALNQAAGASVDFKAVGIDLAKTYGASAALCAAGKLWLDLGGPNLFQMHGQPSRALVMTDWLVHHTSEWLPSADGGV